ncbi:MAG TPA: hypothetical protein VF777_06450 [Phycisphaerales bacterium]
MKIARMAALGGVVAVSSIACAAAPTVEFATTRGFWRLYGDRVGPNLGQFSSFSTDSVAIRVAGSALGGQDQEFVNLRRFISGTYAPYSIVGDVRRSAVGPTSLRFENTQGQVLFTIFFDAGTLDFFQQSGASLGWGATLTNSPEAPSRIERGPLLDTALPAGTMPAVSFRSDGTRFSAPASDNGVLEFFRGEVTSAGVASFQYTCRADLNNDRVVDDADFTGLVVAMDAMICSAAFCRPDLNDDSFIDDADFALFAAAYDRVLCD